MNLDSIVAKAKAIATSLVTLAVGAQTLLTVFATDIANAVPGPYSDKVQAAVVTVVGWLGLAIAALRKLTPAPADQVGVLPPS